MGIKANVGFHDFPKQGDLLHKRILVCFGYDTTRTLMATCVRDDREEPGETIFRLDNGRYIRAVECQYRPVD